MEGLDLAVMVFSHTEGAERAYADAPAQVAGVPWAQEVAFVEHHGRDRIVVRGEFAGRYVDADDEQEFLGRKAVEGALTGAVAGAVFGPPGFAAGIVGGGVAGSVAEERFTAGVRAPPSHQRGRSGPRGRGRRQSPRGSTVGRLIITMQPSASGAGTASSGCIPRSDRG